MTFQIAGMTDPTIEVPRGAQVKGIQGRLLVESS
jgi:hypothetical protein